MKQPLNYAILLYFTKHAEGHADSVIEELRPDYGSYRAFKKKGVIEALMTAKENGILEETGAEIVGGGHDGGAGHAGGAEHAGGDGHDGGAEHAGGDELRVSYRLTEYGRDLIQKFL